MDRRKFLKTSGIGAAALTFGSQSYLTSCISQKLPNIVLIFIDDQGYADVGCFGAKGFKTPNLDQMAREGMRFTDFHVSQAVCSASRASLLTGCYSERVGIQGALNPWAKHGLNPEEETIADLLKKRGYATGIFGKWHLGDEKEFLPLNQGFDEYFGLPYSNDMWPVGYDGKPLNEGHKSFYPRLPLIEGNETVGYVDDLDDQSQLTTMYTERAIKFIEKNKDHPFFLYLPHSMVHVPLGVSDKFKGKSEQGMFGDVMMEVDWSVGQVLETLKKNNLDKSTLVIYTSDNGPWLNFGNHAGSALPLREGKGNMWEGGDRVPCIMRWPGKIPAGKECKKIASTIDILPTLCNVTGADQPVKKIDGVDIWPLMAGIEGAEPRKQFYYYYGRQLCGVREGDWKLMFPHTYRSYEGVEPGKDGFPGPYSQGTCGLELYNLKEDISEKKVVTDEYPEIVERLKRIGDQAREDLGDSLTGAKGKGVREPGRKQSRKELIVNHKAIGKKIKLVNQPNPRYTGKGAETLVNGRYGSDDYLDGQWLGYEGINFEATIDLGSREKIDSISCGTLQDQVSWIFFPKSVQFSISDDGEKFTDLKTINLETKIDQETKHKDITAKDLNTQARYVRIKADNVGNCPPWHPGAGGKAWVFVDEVIVN
jgi:arylsulfatase A-like enzyme